jgi:hypothetical protein
MEEAMFSKRCPQSTQSSPRLKACLLLTLCLCTCCGPFSDVREHLDPDLRPPLLLGVRTVSEEHLELLFDEPPFCRVEEIAIDPPLGVVSAWSEGCHLVVQVDSQLPGAPYRIEALVEDETGNGLHFMAVFYGFNGQLPGLLINEFTTRGTGNHPDAVELKVTEEGNMAGVVLYGGTPGSHDGNLVFPAFPVSAGDYLIVHFKPQGLPEEVNETEARDLSGGLDASDRAYDFWIPEGTGLSGNNGVVSLYTRPGGEILDGVLYSNRSSGSDERYSGFGTRDSLDRALELAADGGWAVSEAGIRPEDAVSPEGSTGTRSICRASCPADTDSAADWHIVPTRGSTFGRENSDEVYAP